MSRKQLFNLVLPEDGLLCIVGLMSDRSKPPTVKYFSMGEEASEKHINDLDNRGYEVYFGVASYIDSTQPKEVRNVLGKKAFYVDLDCGKEDGYVTKAEAVTELLSFSETVGLPKPAIVDSGYGVHAYWGLNETIDYNTWKPIADAFKKKTIDMGLKADKVVTADGARILRVPETTNKKKTGKQNLVKYKRPAEPISLHDFTNAIGYIPRGIYTASSSDPVMDALRNNSATFKFSRIYKKSIEIIKVSEKVEEEYTLPNGDKALRLVTKEVERSAGCPQLAYCVANRETLPEKMWRGALSVAQCCVDRVEAIDMVSRGYPGTEPDEWYTKAAKTNGAYHCTQWKELDQPQLCGQCIHRGKFVTPLSLGVLIEAATPEDNIIETKHEGLGETITIEIPNEYPFPWLRPKNGGVAYRGSPDDKSPSENPEDDPDEVLVYEHDLWVKERRNEGGREQILIARRLPLDGLAEFVMPLSHAFKTDKLQEALADHGISAAHNPKRLELLKRYIAAWVHKIQKETKVKKARAQFGWCDNDTRFVIGNREIDMNGDIHFSPTAASISDITEIYSSKGTLKEWQRVANTYGRRGSEARAFSLFASFGAPLYKFNGEGSMVIHLTNVASGVGKSTAQKVATSVWGDPVKGLLNQNDTPNAMLHRAGILNNIMIGIDEITNIRSDRASDFAFELYSGRGKNRMHSQSNTERKNDTTWATIFQTSGNNSLHDVLKTHKAIAEGEMYRVLEIPMPQDTSLSKEEADELFAHTLPKNYGMAGEIYMQYVTSNRENVIERLRKMQKKFDRESGIGSKQRLYSACFAAAFTGAEIANKLGIIDIPMDHVWKWAIKLVRKTVDVVQTASVIDSGRVVSKFWNEKIGQILTTSGGASELDGMLLNQESLRPVINQLVGRYDKTAKRLYIAVSVFDEWMTAQRMPTSQVKEQLLKEGYAIEIKMYNLGESTSKYDTAPVQAIVFDTEKLNPPKEIDSPPMEG